MPKSLRKERVFRQREQEILDAAAGLFDQMDWRTVTADRIAEDAGIGKGTLYLHFRNKDEIVARLILRHLKRVLGALAAFRPERSLGRWAHLVAVARRHAEERPQEARHMPLLFDTGFPAALSTAVLDELAAARSALLSAIASQAEGHSRSAQDLTPEREAQALFAWGAISAALYGAPPRGSLDPEAAERLRQLLPGFLISGWPPE